MKRQNLILLATLAASLSSHAEYKIDKSEDFGGIALRSGKNDSVRRYTGSASRTIPYPIAVVRKGITNFADKCNNKLRSKREFTPASYDCKYHHEQVVESFLETGIPQTAQSESYLVGKKLYHLGNTRYYELVEVRDGTNEKGQRTTSISQRMLGDEEVTSLIKPKFKKSSDFDTRSVVYTLTETSPKETFLTYEYTAETDHWVLNKQLNVPQIFSSISKTIKEALTVIDKEASEQSRSVASQY